jgi:anti-sigma B factor antagonist
MTLHEAAPRPGVVVIAVAGECDLSQAGRLEEVVLRAGASAGEVILDLSGLEFVDSTGLRTLWRAKQALDGDGSRLVLARPSAAILRVLAISNLDDQFEICDHTDPPALRAASW